MGALAGHFERVRRVFDAVSTLPAGDRWAQAEALCAGDEAVRTEVHRLLEADAKLGEAQGDGTAGSPVRQLLGRAFDERAEALPPATIGPYRVVRRLSAGGMGTVFECVDAMGAGAAVKLLHPSLCAPRSMRRFEHEAIALQRLHHPSIAAILGHGTADVGLGPQPYIAMELVGGVPLDEFVRGLPLVRRLELLGEVADAVHEIHLCGVVHRDLKPDNILVTPEGQPRIVDFGVAQLDGPLGEAGVSLTLSGQLPGTLAYMSPEQAHGAPADPRSDVYALGVIAFEALGGRRPLDLNGLALARALDAVRAGPSAVRWERPLVGDVRAVLERAMALAPGDRYPSAAELGEEFRRLVRGDAVVARRPGRATRIRRWMRRHRPAVRAGLAVGVLVVVLSGAAGVSALRARAAEARAGQWRHATDDAFNVLGELLVNVSPHRLGPDASATDLLDAIASNVDALASTPQARVETRSRIAYTYYLLEDFAKAETVYRQNLRDRAALLGPDDPDAVGEMIMLALVLGADERPGEALALIEEAAARSERLWPGGEAKSGPMLLLTRAIALGGLGRFAESRTDLERALVLARGVHDDEHPLVLKVELHLAEARLALGDQEGLVEHLSSIIDRNRRIRAGTHARTVRAKVCLGVALRREGRSAESEAVLLECLPVFVAQHGEEHPATMYARACLGETLIALGRYAEAEDLLRDVVEWDGPPLWLGEHGTHVYRLDLAWALAMQGRTAEASALIAGLEREAMRPDARVSRAVRVVRAFLFTDGGQCGDGLACFQHDELDGANDGWPIGPTMAGSIQTARAECLLADGRGPEAARAARAAVESLELSVEEGDARLERARRVLRAAQAPTG